MNNLVNLGSHGNQINTIILREEGLIRKYTDDNSKIKYLINEINGLIWYKNQTNKKINIPKLNHFNDFTKIEINLFKGKSVHYRSCLRITYNYLYKFIDHYVKVWKEKDKPIIHGDLTLSNIIYYKNEITIIDWEHFYEGSSPWGFDLVYLILSSLILSSRNKLKPHYQDIIYFKKLWKILFELEIKKELLYSPLTYFKEFFQSNHFWQNILEESPRKLYPMTLSEKEIIFYENKLIKPFIKFIDK